MPEPTKQAEPKHATPQAEKTPQKTNTLSIVGLVMSIIVPIVGLVLSIVALFQIKKTNQKGEGLAIAGVVVSTVLMLFTVAAGFAYIFIFTDTFLPDNKTDQYKGYNRGFCKEGYYEAWSGGAPSGNRKSDNICLDKSGIDAKKAGEDLGGTAKPVIYLYPTSPQEVSVKLKYDGQLTDIYPGFNQPDGWKVLAKPSGELTDLSTLKPYSYLFWEGQPTKEIALPDDGFVVKGSDTAEFLQQKLAYLGLTPKEYNEMIVYWLPKMQHNAYNHVYFATTSYTDIARLEVEPKPDSVLRVFMVFKPLDQPKQVKEQSLQTFERKGFSVIEWGGSELK
ncbi:MAG: DUF4190 domain-containing protein [Candidatus Saccharibacteria bacterium]